MVGSSGTRQQNHSAGEDLQQFTSQQWLHRTTDPHPAQRHVAIHDDRTCIRLRAPTNMHGSRNC
jgi:hypothetical protein